MKEESELTELDFTKLEGFFGFLGVILAISMTIAWEYIANWNTGQFNHRMAFKSLTTLYFIACILLLILIISFYLARIEDKDELASKIAIRILNLFDVVLLLLLLPLFDVLVSSNPLGDFWTGIVNSLGIILVLLIVGFLVLSIILERVSLLKLLEKMYKE